MIISKSLSFFGLEVFINFEFFELGVFINFGLEERKNLKKVPPVSN